MADIKSLESGVKYACFISYSHRGNNAQWAAWLQNALESYRVPPGLVGQPNRAGKPIPDRIFPVFRDETSASGSHNLTKELMTALDRSEYLVVVCSPEAVKSRWMAEEIKYFKSRNKPENVFGVVISGDPGADEGLVDDCQPRPLRYTVDETGELTRTAASVPLMPDFRALDGGPGFLSSKAFETQLRGEGFTHEAARDKAESYKARLENMKLKLIAGLLDVPLDQLTEREIAHQEKQRKVSEREASFTFMIFCLAPFLIAMAWGYMAYLRGIRIADLDRDALLVRVGDLVYMQAIMDNLGSAFVAVAGLIFLATLRLRQTFSVKHLMVACSVFVVLSASAYMALTTLSYKLHGMAVELDQIAAAEMAVIEPDAPNIRRLFDQYRMDGSEFSQACSANAPDCERGSVVNTWLRKIRFRYFLPPIVIMSLIMFGLIGLRWRKESSKRQSS